ncbi:protoporphyrinogen/coproporphyrinogen oxidase [Microbacterium sp. SSM24]|uniref:protoporphyrinogen/coproporphyrinogen oxidase n=1 Tax=Microbacterium sp. SSM24 TaxID=2991714 RepID=UPI0022272E39|nr:FAD-dependent oxidoreductase [Microbacterium sp. SSM24]MCW3493160.1 FAD-dependent oxidoreductase [Microbacterium sp. SSM24]
MPAAPEPFDELMHHARETRVVVVGGGIAGLLAAWECAKVGMPVTVLEASDAFGGTISSAEVDGIRIDTGASCWTAGGVVRELVEELGLGDLVVTPADDRTWIAGLPKGAAAPVPQESVLGIPANPWDESVRRFIGWGGVWRAYLDRLRPPLTIGKERSLARLVRTRMGEAVLDRMVAPLSVGRFGITPDRVDVASAAPGLSSALTRTGSLGGAVADLLVGRDGPAVESLDGGLAPLVDALVARLRGLGAELVTGVRIDAIERTPDDRWRVIPDLEGGGEFEGEIVVVAAGPQGAAGLLAPHAGSAVRQMTTAASRREIVTLVVDAPRLDGAPRGGQVYAVPGSGRASGVVHATARWGWLAEASGPGVHVLQVAFDRPAGDSSGIAPTDTAPTEAALPDAEAVATARAEASALLGVPLDADVVRDWRRTGFALPLPASALGHDDHAAAVREAVAALPGLAAVGAWLAGSGLAQVVADARNEAERVRRAALWASPASD